MKVSIIEERQKIESIQEQIANDEVPTHDSAYSSRQTTASPTPIPQPSPRKVSKIIQDYFFSHNRSRQFWLQNTKLFCFSYSNNKNIVMKDEIHGIQKLVEQNRQIYLKWDQKWAQKIQIFIEGENRTKSKYLTTKIIWKQLRYVHMY